MTLFGAASPAAACSLLTNVSEWMFGAAYLTVALLGLVTVAIFRRSALIWVGMVFGLVIVADLSAALVIGDSQPADTSRIVRMPSLDASDKILVDGCGPVGHASASAALWAAIQSAF